MQKEKAEHKNAKAFRAVEAALFKAPLAGWLKQVRMRGIVHDTGESAPKVCQVIVGLFAHHHDFMDVELIVNPSRNGLTLIIPKKSFWSNFQLTRAYKKPCGSLEVQFDFKQKRVHRSEQPLKPHQALLGWQRE